MISEKRFKSIDRRQPYLLPPALDEWLPEGHLANFIIDTVEQLDLSELYGSYGGDGRGQPPYDPSMMTALLLYAYSVGMPSSRRVERATYEDIGFRVVAANQHPDHDSICAFRKRHLKVLAGLFVQVLRLCREAGLVKLGHVALDGTKVKANASRHKAMSYKRMKKEREKLERQVAELLDLAERVDAEEEARYGKGVRGDELPEGLRNRQGRLKKIREAMAALEAEARQEAEAKAEEAKEKVRQWEERSKGRAKHRRGKRPKVPDAEEAKAKDGAQRNFTDPDSRIMIDGATKSYQQSYNGQAAVDGHQQVIVACGLTQSATDRGQTQPMVERIEQNTGQIPSKVTADADYWTEANIEFLESKQIDAYIAVEKMKHGDRLPACRGRPPKGMSKKDRMRRKLRTKKGWSVYAKRKYVVEPVFGQIKHTRGLRQFLLRGFNNVEHEWTLWCLSHNLLKLYRHGTPALA